MLLKKNILLTGNPGVGKTTIIKKVISGLKNAGGFFTEEIRESGKRTGFRIITLDGKTGTLAYKGRGEYKIGSYSVNIKDLEEIAVKSIISAIKSKEIIVIDEIGKMEIFSFKFRDAVIGALNSSKFVIGVIHRENSGFFREIKERDDVELMEVRVDNRDNIVDGLKEAIISRIKFFKNKMEEDL